MTRNVLMLLVVGLAGLTLLAAGCGGGSSDTAAETTTTETTTTETTTTEESTTESTETSEESTDTTGSSDFASAENCQEFAQLSAKISDAFSGADQDLEGVADQLNQLASVAPDEIKSDFETLADGYGQIADAVGNLKAGETPSADDLAKLSQLGTEWSTKMTTAATNIATWAQENCT